MNVVIMGCGRTGTLLTRTLSDAGHAVTVIDLDRTNASGLSATKMATGEIRVIEGDGTQDRVLEEARINDADLFVSVTGDDPVNGLAALKARMKFRVMSVVAAVWSGDLSSVFESLGVACVNPGRLATDNIIASVPEVLQSLTPANGDA
jgi:trk system potassium uptake protein TrkA